MIIGGVIGALVLLFGRRRDRAFEYPEQPEPLKPWWYVTTSPVEATGGLPVEAVGALTWTWVD